MVRENWVSRTVLACVLALVPAVAFGESGQGDGQRANSAVVVDANAGESKSASMAESSQAVFTQEQDSGQSPSTSGSQANADGERERPWFLKRLLNAYIDEFNPPPSTGEPAPEPARRALPSPWDAPPFPSSEYQGNPIIGIPLSTKEYPLEKALKGGPFGNLLTDNRIRTYGWVNGSYNWSTNKNSNMPTSYWIVPNSIVLNQAVFRVEREVDTVQTDHVDFGFRATGLYGVDYRYMTAGGYFYGQYDKHNFRYGFDPTELYVDTYVPGVVQGLVLRVGRWVATPDIETQFAPDNYLGTHSLLFTVDTYTQTGVMATLMLNQQWTVQAGVHAGTDMAPWYKGATPTGMAGIRWVALDNNDSVYLVLNAINNAKFRDFQVDGQPDGHENFNYLVGTWQHRFTREIHTKLEGYYMWERDGFVGGSPSIGPARSFGGGGGRGASIPGTSHAYGLLNYTMFGITQRDFITVRNEWWRDDTGFRSGFAGHYSSHTLGWMHQFNDILMIRPEIGYYRNWTNPAFDLGKERDMLMIGADMTLRF